MYRGSSQWGLSESSGVLVGSHCRPTEVRPKNLHLNTPSPHRLFFKPLKGDLEAKSTAAGFRAPGGARGPGRSDRVGGILLLGICV